MVVGSVALRSDPSVGTLIWNLCRSETQSKTAQGVIGSAAGKAHHGRGIHAAAEQNADRNVTDHVQPDGFIQKFDKLLFSVCCGYRGRIEIQVPVLMNFRITLSYDHVRARSQLEDVLEESILARNEIEGKKAIDDFRPHPSADLRIGQDGLDFRPKNERIRSDGVINRLDSHPVPGQHQRLLALIPNRKSEHAPKSFYTGRPEFLIEVNDHFGIRASTEHMASGQEIVTEFLEVIDFPIKDNPDGPILIRQRLMTRCQIDDGKTAKAQAHWAGPVVAFIVRTTMRDGVGHSFQQAAGDWLLPIEIQLTADSAHRLFSPSTCFRATARGTLNPWRSFCRHALRQLLSLKTGGHRAEDQPPFQ